MYDFVAYDVCVRNLFLFLWAFNWMLTMEHKNKIEEENEKKLLALKWMCECVCVGRRKNMYH
jgi:hypothetical protein